MIDHRAVVGVMSVGLAIACAAHRDQEVRALPETTPVPLHEATRVLVPLKGKVIRDDFGLPVKGYLYRIAAFRHETIGGRQQYQAVVTADGPVGPDPLDIFIGTPPPPWPRVVFNIPLCSVGDVADLYCRITEEKHPTLKGELSKEYKAFLRGNWR